MTQTLIIVLMMTLLNENTISIGTRGGVEKTKKGIAKRKGRISTEGKDTRRERESRARERTGIEREHLT